MAMAEESNRINQWLGLILEQRQLSDAMQVLNDETHDGGFTAAALFYRIIFRDLLNAAVLALQDAGNDEHQIFQDLWRLGFQASLEAQQLLYGLRRLAIQGLQKTLDLCFNQLGRNDILAPATAIGGNDGNGFTECSICLQEFVDDEDIILMPCPSHKHGFHIVCIARWLVISKTCPVCRRELAELSSTSSLEFVRVIAK